MLLFNQIVVYFTDAVDSSLFLCWHPGQALITSSLRLTSSQSMQPLPIARMNTGICHFSSQKPFITHYNRDVKHLLQFPNATPVELLVIIHDSLFR